jgi:hypothetical protein
MEDEGWTLRVEDKLGTLRVKMLSCAKSQWGVETGDYPQVCIRHSKPQSKSILPRIYPTGTMSLIHTDF